MIIDFDGTLVLENSSRELEKVIFEHLSGARRLLIGLFFFGAASRFTNLLLGFLAAKVLFQRKDIRLWLFCWLSSGAFAKHYWEIIEKTCARLNFNKELLNNIRSSEVVILSCGLGEIITHFLKKNNLQFFKVKCSSKLENRGDGVRTGLISYNEKLKFLVKNNSFIYLTDDGREINMIKRHFEKTKEKVLLYGGRKIFGVELLK